MSVLVKARQGKIETLVIQNFCFLNLILPKHFKAL